MASRELKALFRAYKEGDELAFRRAAQEIIEEEESKRHTALARDLRALISGGSSEPSPLPPRCRRRRWIGRVSGRWHRSAILSAGSTNL